jgi:hypothetical protein
VSGGVFSGFGFGLAARGFGGPISTTSFSGL